MICPLTNKSCIDKICHEEVSINYPILVCKHFPRDTVAFMEVIMDMLYPKTLGIITNIEIPEPINDIVINEDNKLYKPGYRLMDKQPPQCSMCKNDDQSLMTVEHRDKTTKIICDICSKVTIIDEKSDESISRISGR